MNTPIIDFGKKYQEKNTLRLHMPGHKGKSFLGIEGFDITEIEGADVLYSANGIIEESQNNASALFHTAKTLYSCEGSSLSIRAMLYLALLSNRTSNTILAARNAHKVFMSAAALLDFKVECILGIIVCLLFTAIPRFAAGACYAFMIISVNRLYGLILIPLFIIINFLIWYFAYYKSFKKKKY